MSISQRVKSSLSSSPITGSFWAGLATFLVTCPVERLNLMAVVIGIHGNVRCPNNTGWVTFMSNLSYCLVKIFVHMTHCYIFNSQEPNWCYPNCL